MLTVFFNAIALLAAGLTAQALHQTTLGGFREALRLSLTVQDIWLTVVKGAVFGAGIGTLCAFAGLLGVLVAPDLALLWMVFLGIGQGGALGLALMLPVLRGRDAGQVAGMTAMAMGVGYLIAAGGPALVGAVRDVSGNWTAPLFVLLAMTLVQLPVSLYAAKGRPT